MKSKVLATCLVTLLSLAGCSGGGTTESATGGSSETGGQAQTGGSGGNTGGSPGSGGTTSTGGSSAFGGTTSSGGSGTGGSSATGGRTGTGGSSASGGTTSTGGAGSGGTTATGGTTAKGGNPGSGGTTATGGTTSRGGADGGVGGTTGTGGTTSAGGTTGSGGSTVVSACGLPAGPDSGVAAPTGSGTKFTVLPWAGFKAATSISLDDGNQSQIDNYNTLNGMGVPLTFYLVTGWSAASNAIWKQAVKDGHEIGNHTQSHSCGTASAGESDIESKYGVTAYTLAAPNGDTACGAQAQSLNLLLNRGVNGGTIAFTAAESTAWNLPTNLPAQGAGASALTSAIDSAYSSGTWQTFCIHGFTGDANAYQPIPLTSLTDAIKTEKAKKDLWIDTMAAVGAYWRAGLVFAAATSSTSGTDKTWKWTVPTNFPPNSCLRVSTDGGVVKQNGTAIAWDSHGYYEISFNAGQVTLSAQ